MPNTAAEAIQLGALTVRFHADADESGGSVSVYESEVPANARMPAPHSHDEFDETVFGLDGVTTFTVGGERTDLNPGEALFIPRSVIHGFSNDGDVDARFLAVISPGLMGSRYFRDVADVLAGGARRTSKRLARSCAVTALLSRHRPDRLEPATAPWSPRSSVAAEGRQASRSFRGTFPNAGPYGRPGSRIAA